MNCFGFFHYIFSFFFTVLVVHPHHDHPVTTVLTHYSPKACYSLFVLKELLNTNQPTNQPTVAYLIDWWLQVSVVVVVVVVVVAGTGMLATKTFWDVEWRNLKKLL